MIGRIAYALVVGIALGIIVAGGVAYAVSRRDPAPAPARGDAAAPFDLALTVTEEFLTRQINNPPPPPDGEPERRRPQLREATVRIRPDGTIEASGTTTLLGLPVPVRAVLLPRVVGGQLEMAIIEGRAGALGIPAGVAADVEEIVNRQLRATLARRAFQVVAIEPGEGTLLIRLK